MSPLGRSEFKGFPVVVFAEAEVYSPIQHLPGKRRIAAEAVHRPLHRRAQALLRRQQQMKGAHAMNRHGQAVLLREQNLPFKNFCLQKQKLFFSAPALFQSVKATLSERHYLLVCQQAFKTCKGRLIRILRPPGMNAGGIHRAGTRQEGLLAEDNFPRQGNNGICGIRIVRVEVQAINDLGFILYG